MATSRSLKRSNLGKRHENLRSRSTKSRTKEHLVETSLYGIRFGEPPFLLCLTSQKGTTEAEQENSFNFLLLPKGSAAEVRCQLYVALDQNYVDAKQFDGLGGVAEVTANMIGGLMNYLRRSGYKGTKYKSTAP